MNFADLVVAEVENLQVLKAHQLFVQRLYVISLSEEGPKEFVQVLCRADVLVEAKLLDYLIEFECFFRPTGVLLSVSAWFAAYHFTSS